MNTKRIVFSKGGDLVFISHLDLTHTFVRALNRASLPIEYSSGFNPHPKIVFAMPLSVGMKGENELCDITLKNDEITDDEFYNALKNELPEQIVIKKVYSPDVKFNDVKNAVYTITIDSDADLSESITTVLSSPLSAMKKTKSGIKEVELTSRIKEFSVSSNGKNLILCMTLDASPQGYLGPELVMTALKEKNVITDRDTYFVSRDKILF